MFKPVLEANQVLSNRELMNIFHCACEGGIRPANATDSIVLVLNHTHQGLGDEWRNGTLYFTGAGSLGDQTLEKGKNKTLVAAFKNGRPVYLFEVFKRGEYVFQGKVGLAGNPYEKEGPDREGKMRKVWVFPLKKED